MAWPKLLVDFEGKSFISKSEDLETTMLSVQMFFQPLRIQLHLSNGWDQFFK